jgi:hypothetical protein
LRTAIRDTTVFRGHKIDSDHYLLQSKIHKQYYIKKRNTKSTKSNIRIKIHLLEEDSIEILHGNRPKDKFKHKETGDTEENWLNIKRVILEEAKEGLRYKPIKKKTWIKTCNEEQKQIIDIKKHEDTRPATTH